MSKWTLRLNNFNLLFDVRIYHQLVLFQLQSFYNLQRINQLSFQLKLQAYFFQYFNSYSLLILNKSKKIHLMNQQIKQKYFNDVFNLLKTISFHELYIQTHRIALCQNIYFDPLTAFKIIDSFKHNMIVACELQSFMENMQIQSTIKECQLVISAINKDFSDMNYQRFIEAIMPYDLVKRNLSLTRYNNLKVQVGTYSFLHQLKQNTKQAIALFFQKQILFYRQFLEVQQQFARNWGSDIYTFCQELFKKQTRTTYQLQKNHKTQFNSLSQTSTINFQQFYNFCRTYKVFFNEKQFKAIWRRSKQSEQTVILKQQEVLIDQRNFHTLFLTENFHTKLNFMSQYQIPINSIPHQAPSYKNFNKLTYENSNIKQKLQNQQFCKQFNNSKVQLYQITKYKPTYSLIDLKRMELKKKEEDWKQTCSKMNQEDIQFKYFQLQSSKRGALRKRW